MSIIPLNLKTDFECANAENVRRLDATSFELSTKPDNAVDNEYYRMADYYAAFRIINPNHEPVQARVLIRELSLPDTGRTLAVRDIEKAGPVLPDDWRPLSKEGIEILAEESAMRISVTVKPQAMLDVSTMYWMSASEVMARLEEVKGKHSKNLNIFSIGRTAESRDIPVVDLSPMAGNAEPLGCISATPQGHELGTIVVMGILQEILAGKLEELVRRYRLVLLPLTNPDGNAHGTCMTNSLRQNIIFGYGKAGTGKAAGECEAVWAYLNDLKPDWFLEFHSYPHLNRPSFRPYDFDLSIFPGEDSRKFGKAFFEAIKTASPNPPVVIKAGSDMERRFRASLVSRLIRKSGIPATIYKLHNRETVQANRQHAVSVLESVVRAMKQGVMAKR